MKILKKFFIISIFSFLFIINVKALTNFNSPNLSALNNYLSYNSDKDIEDLQNLIYESYDFDNLLNNYENYIVLYRGTTSTSNRIDTIILYTNNDLYLAMSNYGYLYIRSSSNFTYVQVSFTFNSNYSDFTTITDYNGATSTNNIIAIAGTSIDDLILFSNLENLEYKAPSISSSWQPQPFTVDNGLEYSRGDFVPLNYFGGSRYTYNVVDIFNLNSEPTYTISQEILENGNVKLTFNFNNYETNNGYGFTITNKVSGEEYGITNPFTSIYPNIVPFGNTYEIELDYNTVITVSLSKYTPIEGTQLYDREPLYVDSYDITNVVFDNVQNPNFSIVFQNKNNLIGKFNNIKNGYTCFYKYNNSNVENSVNCNETLDIIYNNNGYVDIIIKNGNNILYDRKINIQGGDETQPYIVYNMEKQDFYSRVNWRVENYNNQLKYRYSTDNGQNFTNWEVLSNNQQYINVYQNSTIIIEVSNSDQSTIYDSKAINVIVSVENIKDFNNSTNNIINKFNNIFKTNGNILEEINKYWQIMKNSKLYLLIFIPFITSIICAIIYLIRRA